MSKSNTTYYSFHTYVKDWMMVENVIATMYNKLSIQPNGKCIKTLFKRNTMQFKQKNLLLDIHYSTSTLTSSLSIPILPTFLQLLFLFWQNTLTISLIIVVVQHESCFHVLCTILMNVCALISKKQKPKTEKRIPFAF